MADFCLVQVCGRLVKTPILKTYGKTVVFQFSIASNNVPVVDKENKKTTYSPTYLDVVFYSSTAEALATSNMKKGIPITVEGDLLMRSYKDTEGKNRIKYIVKGRRCFLGQKESSQVIDEAFIPDEIGEDLDAQAVL